MTQTFSSIFSAGASKAWAAGLLYLFGAVQAEMTSAHVDSVTALTQLQWLNIIVWTLSAFAVVYKIPNETPAEKQVAILPVG